MSQPKLTKDDILRFIRRGTKVAHEALDVYFKLKHSSGVLPIALGALSSFEIVDKHLCRKSVHEYVHHLQLQRIHGTYSRIVQQVLDALGVSSVIVTEDNGHILVRRIWRNAIEFYVLTERRDTESCEVYVQSLDTLIPMFQEYFQDSHLMVTIEKAGYVEYPALTPVAYDVTQHICASNEEEIATRILQFQAKNINRSVLFYGQPGTGKTLYTFRLAQYLGGRVIIVPTQTLQQFYTSELEFEVMLQLLKPAVLLFDDLDRYDDAEKLLWEIESLSRRLSHKVVIIATVNDIERLPAALRRPGRFDELKEFPLPDAATRLKLLKHFQQTHGTRLMDSYLELLVMLTDGLSHAYLNEVMLRATILSFEQLVVEVERMQQFAPNLDASEAS